MECERSNSGWRAFPTLAWLARNFCRPSAGTFGIRKLSFCGYTFWENRFWARKVQSLFQVKRWHWWCNLGAKKCHIHKKVIIIDWLNRKIPGIEVDFDSTYVSICWIESRVAHIICMYMPASPHPPWKVLKQRNYSGFSLIRCRNKEINLRLWQTES
jgi:hypothetical protein